MFQPYFSYLGEKMFYVHFKLQRKKMHTVLSSLNKSRAYDFKVIPLFCIAHPYCA